MSLFVWTETPSFYLLEQEYVPKTKSKASPRKPATSIATKSRDGTKKSNVGSAKKPKKEMEEKWSDVDGARDEDVVCVTCHLGTDEHKILLCDYCDRGYHMYCLDPP